MKNYTTLLGLLFLSFQLFAQQQRWIDVANNGDCISAIEISIKDTTNAIASPKGHGKILEFKNNDPKSLLYVQREHNTVWYKFDIPADMELTFELTPFSIDDDYDFMLFKYQALESDNFCQALIDKKIEPIRTNISRNNKEIQSKTGLNNLSKNPNTVHSGPGEGYSRFVDAKKGTTFYLLVDNVYKNGKGHQLTFQYDEYFQEEAIIEELEIVEAPSIERKPEPIVNRSDKVNYTLEGVVLDEETNQPIKADIRLINAQSGQTILETQSDSITGEYKLTITEDKNKIDYQSYTIEISKDGYFFNNQDISPAQLPRLDGIKVRTKIPKLKKGDTFNITSINFYGDSPKPLPRSYPTFKALLKVMKKNKNLKISIEGHTNGCHKSVQFSENLSVARAETVKNYLTENGISGDRILHSGAGCRKMLYANPTNAREQILNRRVEIKILSYDKERQ